MTLGCWISLAETLPAPGGSWAKTSSATPEQRPSWSASRSACSSMMPPRATLMIRTVFLHWLNVCALIKSNFRPQKWFNLKCFFVAVILIISLGCLSRFFSYGAFHLCRGCEVLWSLRGSRFRPAPIIARCIRGQVSYRALDRKRLSIHSRNYFSINYYFIKNFLFVCVCVCKIC